MYYKVIEQFGPEKPVEWKKYIDWRKLDLDRFDSVDGMLCPDFFNPESDEDWANCVNADFKLNLITNLEYALKVKSKTKNSLLVGVDMNSKRMLQTRTVYLDSTSLMSIAKYQF